MAWPLSWVNPDGAKIIASRAVRSFAYGFLSVLLGIYLQERGLDNLQIGIIFSLALAGGALSTIIMSLVADRLGRRRLLVLSGILMALAGAAFAWGHSFTILAVAAIIGTISPSAMEVGPFRSLEQAMLPQTCPKERRTDLFAWYSLLGTLAAALGALFAGLPKLLQSLWGLDSLDAMRVMLLVYVGSALLATLLFSRLSDRVELSPEGKGSVLGLKGSRAVVAKLSFLSGVDSFAGGFVLQSIVALWFFQKFGLSLDRVATIFFVSGLLTSGSFLVAARLAARIGLLNTMVFTHLPSNLLLMTVPLAPTLPVALGLYLARMALSQMDVPTRQSYIMAVVEPEERTSAAGITNTSRTVAQSMSPFLAGYAMQSLSSGLPFFVGGGLKSIYDLALYISFRRVRPAEEARGTPEQVMQGGEP